MQYGVLQSRSAVGGSKKKKHEKIDAEERSWQEEVGWSGFNEC